MSPRVSSLWDLSTIRGLPEDTDHRDLREKALVTGFETKYACSSAYFDPTGTRLATTSYDDMIRRASWLRLLSCLLRDLVRHGRGADQLKE